MGNCDTKENTFYRGELYLLILFNSDTVMLLDVFIFKLLERGRQKKLPSLFQYSDSHNGWG